MNPLLSPMLCPVCGDEIPMSGYAYVAAVKQNKPSRLYFCSTQCKTGYRSGTAQARVFHEGWRLGGAAEVGT